MSDDFKEKGNAALKAGKFSEAVKFYTDGINIDPTNHVLFSNRSAAYAKLNEYTNALADSEVCIKLNSNWGKGYSRKGAALCYLDRHDEAIAVYEEGLKVDPDSSILKSGLKDATAARDSMERKFANPFAQPDAVAKLRLNPKTSGYFNDPSFVQTLNLICRDPNSLTSAMSDKRLIDCLAVLLNINLSTASPEEFSSSPPPKKQSYAKEEPPKPKISSEEEQSLAEKEQGNIAYRSRDFENALLHYGKAVDLDPRNCSFLLNQAAVYFEMVDYDKCVERCLEAVEVGRTNQAGYQTIAKAFARIGNAYVKQHKLEDAMHYYSESLAEHRNPEIMKKELELKKQIEREKQEAYIDVDASEKERLAGNDLFQKFKFPEAMKHYNEAIARNHKNPILYSNRAACYTKLNEFSFALKDCNEALKLDDKFTKAYMRKANCQLIMKDFSGAKKTYNTILEYEPENREAHNGIMDATRKQYSSGPPSNPEDVKSRIRQDPEVMAILEDPAMRMILSQMQENPGAIQSHLQNKEIASKIQKLIDVGVIQMG